MISRHNIVDIHAIQERVEYMTYQQFMVWLTLNGGNIVEENRDTISFNYNTIMATITKESHLNGEFELYDEVDWIGLMNTEIVRFKSRDYETGK